MRRPLDGLGPAIGMLQKAIVSRVQEPYIKGASISPRPINSIRPIHRMSSIIQLLQDFLVVIILFVATQDSVIGVDLHVI